MKGTKTMSDQLEGRNAVKEALKGNRDIYEIFMLTSGKEQGLQEIQQLAKRRKINIREVDRRQMDQMSRTGHHQGVIASVPAYAYASLEDIISTGKQLNEPLILLLDGVEDPHNLGSVLRSAEVFGATGLVIPKRRAVGVTPTVAKVASGALEHIPVAQVPNMTDAIKTLKKEGFWIAGGDGTSPIRVMKQELTGPLGVVIGSEGKGISRLVREQCDFLVSIPMAGNTGSLNASVAAGILLYEIFRQRARVEETEEAR
jgi:23S rRNA (guanosine2251-2'-O)-methyltransferase